MTTVKTIHQVSFLAPAFPVNCYLVEEENELTLIDAALPYSAKKVLETAASTGKPITRILLTHGHADHVGALDRLKEALPDVPVFLSARDARLLAGDRSLDKGESGFPIRGGVPGNVKTRADVFLKDGDEIGSLQAHYAPGHTPGSMAFLDKRNKALIAGDAFQTKGGVAVSGDLQPFFPFPALATWNKEVALASARRLLKLEPALLATGHGRMVTNPIPHIRRAIEQAEKKIKVRRK